MGLTITKNRMTTMDKRLESLDVLRGFDLFCLTIISPLLRCFLHTGKYTWIAPVMKQFDHAAWSGFTFLTLLCLCSCLWLAYLFPLLLPDI